MHPIAELIEVAYVLRGGAFVRRNQGSLARPPVGQRVAQIRGKGHRLKSTLRFTRLGQIRRTIHENAQGKRTLPRAAFDLYHFAWNIPGEIRAGDDIDTWLFTL